MSKVDGLIQGRFLEEIISELILKNERELGEASAWMRVVTRTKSA